PASRRLRRRGPGQQRPLGKRSSVRPGLATHGRGSGLGSVSMRALGLDRLLRLELGRLRIMGVGPVSLWALVLRVSWMGLVARPAICTLLLASRAGWILRMGRRRWIRIWIR